MTRVIHRIFIDEIFTMNHDVFLSKKIAHHVKNVLRMKKDDILEIFNNTNYIFFAKIKSIKKNIIRIIIFDNKFNNLESHLVIHLGQVISKKTKMDFTVQKSIELGVQTITPLFSENCDIKKNFARLSKKTSHWQKIAIAACQQCRRNMIPIINNPIEILPWCNQYKNDEIKIVFNPTASLTIKDLPKSIKNIRILIGSEKGFSSDEIKYIKKSNFLEVALGPRVLRTETASIVALSILQEKFGDF